MAWKSNETSCDFLKLYLAGFAYLEGTFALYTYTRGEGFLNYPSKCDWMGSKVAENLFDNKEDKFLTNFLDIHLHTDSCLHYCLQTQVSFGVCFVFMAKLFFPLYFLQSIFQFVEKVLRGKKQPNREVSTLTIVQLAIFWEWN